MISKFNGRSIAMLSHCLRQNKSDLSEACRSVFEQSAGPVAGRVK